MSKKLDTSEVVTFGRLLVGLLVLAVMGVGCVLVNPGHWRTTTLYAMIFDLRENHSVGTLNVITEGWVLIPIKFAFTETRACNLIGDAIAKFLSSEEPSEHHDVWVVRTEPTQIESHDAVTAVLYQFGGGILISQGEKVC